MEEQNNVSKTKQTSQKLANLENALDKIREKYGKDAIVRGSNLKK